jgi:PTH1 family peptidyl-tRNA hydrolase
VASIIAETGGEDFIRVKVGVGRDPLIPAERYVLTKFPPAEAAAVAEAIQTAADAVEMIIAEGATQAMNHFNRHSE